jgi:hypothetical protein
VEDKTAVLGSAAWVQHTQGWLTSAERRSLIAPLARTHLSNAVGALVFAGSVAVGRPLAGVAFARCSGPVLREGTTRVCAVCDSSQLRMEWS